MLSDFLSCIAFFTTIPIPRKNIHDQPLSQIAVWLPMVGLLLGMLLLSTHVIASWVLPSLAGAVIILVIWVWTTGGLHLDGLGDCSDAFFSSLSIEKRKEIIKDPHIGSFGVIAICLALLMKLALIYSQKTSILNISNVKLSYSIGLFVAPIVARWAILWMSVLFPIGKNGLGHQFSMGITTRTLALASIIPLILVAFFGIQYIITLVLSIVVTWGVGKLSVNKIGEVRGDVMGMAIELNEIICLLIFVI